MSITKSTYTNRAKEITSINDIPTNGEYMVYLLERNGKTIINGHGKFNRARVIFDDELTLTNTHIKSLVARINHIYGGEATYNIYIIECDSKQEAEAIEKFLHNEIGGNTKYFAEGVLEQLFDGVDETSKMLINIMLNSAFDGQSDLKKWFKQEIIPSHVMDVVVEKFKIAKWIKGYNK